MPGYFLIFSCSKFTGILTTYKHTSEEALVSALQQKDRSALEYLYDHYSSALLGVVVRIIKKEELAEEILQDVFLKIWDRIDSYDASKGKLFTWMLNIARNQAIDKTRPHMAVNATPARHEIGAEQVARAIRKPRLSVAVAVFDLATVANVGY